MPIVLDALTVVLYAGDDWATPLEREKGCYMQIKLTDSKQGVPIAEALFGGNMEPTRRTVWQGLSAQKVANRKFAAQNEGVPCRWNLSGGAAFSEAHDSVCQSGSVVLPAGASLAQENIRVCAGQVYDLSFWVTGLPQGEVQVQLTAADKTLWQQVFVADGQMPLRTSLTASTTAEVALCIQCLQGTVRVEVVSLLPADALCGMRRDVIDGLKTMGMKELRFPGGCYAEVYDWKDGLLEPDRRTPLWPTLYPGHTFLLRDTDGVDSHEIGIHEFMVLCREIGVEPVLTVPVICSELQDGLDLLQYCNGAADTAWGSRRAEAGFPEPFGVRQWCIGNEIYYFGRRMETDPAYAAEVTSNYIRAMKAMDPSVYAIVAFCPERREWNQTYLNLIGDIADGISLHFYMTDELKPTFGHITEEMCLTVVEDTLSSLVEDTRAQIHSILGHSMPIHMDEWAFTWGQEGNVVSAYVDTRLLRFLCAEGDRYDICSAMYFHPVNEGLLKVSDHDTEPDCFGQILPLFLPHCGREGIEISVLTEGRAEFVASRSKEGEIYLTAVSLDDAEELVVYVDGFTVESKSVVQLVPVSFSADCRSYREYGGELTHDNGIRLLPLGVAGMRLIKNADT